MSTKRITYSEGQWFAIPLSEGYYGLGVIVRGFYKSKGGLGYFFGPKYASIDNIHTVPSTPIDAILVAWFGDLGIINGRWPLLNIPFGFRKEDWPVPAFKRLDYVNRNYGWLVEYEQENPIFARSEREVYLPISQIRSLPEESSFGYEALEIQLSKLLV